MSKVVLTQLMNASEPEQRNWASSSYSRIFSPAAAACRRMYSEETDLAGTHNLPVVHEEHGGFAGVQQLGDLGLVALLLLGRESGIAGHPNPVGLVAEHHIDGIVPSLRVAVEISDLLACPGCPRSHAP